MSGWALVLRARQHEREQWVLDSFAALLGRPANVASFSFLAEFLLAVWLLIWRRRVTAIDVPDHHVVG